MDSKYSEMKLLHPHVGGEIARRRSMDSPVSSVYSSVESFKDTERACPVTAFGDDDSIQLFPVTKPSTEQNSSTSYGSNNRIHDSEALVEHSSFIDMDNRHHHHHHAAAPSHAAEPSLITTPIRTLQKTVSSFLGMVGESIKIKNNFKKDISFLQTVILCNIPYFK